MFRSVCRLVLMISVSLATLTAGMKSTQSAIRPLYVELGDGNTGDIFAYTSAGFKNLTSYGYNNAPVLSPDGKYIAYASYAKVFIEEGGRSGAPSRNIWLMETATGDAKRIADQPADTRKVGDSSVRPYTARTDPVWSPDSKFIAWMEDSQLTINDAPDPNDHLLIYNLATGKSKEIYKQEIYSAGCPCSDLAWVAQGIVVTSADNPGGPYVVHVLDTAGQSIMEAKLENWPHIKWLNGETAPAFVTEDEVIKFDSSSKAKRSTTLPPLEVYSLSAPNGLHFRSDGGFYKAQWSIVVPNAEPLAIGKISDYAISPDGKMAAYIAGDDNALYLFDGTTTKQLDLSAIKVRDIDQIEAQGLAWSTVSIRIQPGK